jgi:hypothetical protein
MTAGGRGQKQQWHNGNLEAGRDGNGMTMMKQAKVGQVMKTKKQGSRAELQDREARNGKARMSFQKQMQMSQAWLEPPAKLKLWLGWAGLGSSTFEQAT